MIGDDFDPEDKRPYWYCFSCGKALGKQGSGGDFNLAMGPVPPEAVISFGYGSGFDEGIFQNDLNPHLKDWRYAPHIAGWICDECVVQKHDLLLVRERVPKPEERWDDFKYTKLAEHDSTKMHIEQFDYYGTKKAEYVPPGKTEPEEYTTYGMRDHAEITSKERADLETLLLEKADKISIDRLTLARLLDALTGAEIRIQKHRLAELEAGGKLYHRVRQQAELLTAEEIAEMRRVEDSVTDGRTKLLESVSWYEDRYSKMSDAWRECLRDNVQIHDELNGGKPTIRGTGVTVESVFRLMKLRTPEDVAGQLNVPIESVQNLVVACGNFFDQGFLEIMTYYAEHGYMDRWLDGVTELADSKKKEPADVIEMEPGK